MREAPPEVSTVRLVLMGRPTFDLATAIAAGEPDTGA